MKFLHTVGAIGFGGALVVQLVLAGTAVTEVTPGEYLALRQSIVTVSKWVMVPSMAAVVISGLLAMAIHRPFHNAGWVWIKAVLGVAVLEGSLVGIQGSAEKALVIARDMAESGAGTEQLAALGAVLRTEQGVTWVMLILATANIALTVWRPRRRRKRA